MTAFVGIELLLFLFIRAVNIKFRVLLIFYRMWTFSQHLSFVVLALIPIQGSTIISERVENEYVPPAVYQVGTGNGYHKASDLFRGALNESANGSLLFNIMNNFLKFSL